MRPVPSLRPLFPSSAVVLEVTFEGPVSPEARRTWESGLRDRLRGEEIAVVPPGTPGAVPVSVRVTLESDRGWTGEGTPFVGARARATLRAGRGSHGLEGRAFAGTDSGELARRALEDLLDRVAVALTL